MARKKTSRKRKSSTTKKSAPKKPTKKKAASKKKTVAKKKVVAKKKAATRKQPAKKKSARGKARAARQQVTYPVALRGSRGLDAAAAGQAGDTQGLSRRETENSESVAELVEEGQYFEADAVSGVENAKDPDQGEVTTSEVPEDDVPSEYTDRD